MRNTKISEEAVKKATGKNWKQWFAILDKAGARKMVHKEIARLLYLTHKVPDWWCQMVTVEYEYARNKRVTGETADVGFEIGVQKVFPIAQKKAWALVTSSKGRKLWLGNAARIEFKPGFHFRTKEGNQGEIRTMKYPERLRLTWKPKNFKQASTLQVTLSCPRNKPRKTMIHFHQEKLASPKQRQEMRKHWQGVLEKLNVVVK